MISADVEVAGSVIESDRSFHMKMVAEDVETSQQQASLLERASDNVQGFLFSRPLHPEVPADLPIDGAVLPLH